MKFINTEVFKTTMSKVILGVLAGIIVATFFFGLGTKFGFDRAMFLCLMNKNYERNFIGDRGGSWREISGDNAVGMHGVVGSIISVGSTSLSVLDRDDLEKSIQISSSTSIKSFNKKIGIFELKVNDKVIIFGSPNDKGQIQATMVRIAPGNMPMMDRDISPVINNQ